MIFRRKWSERYRPISFLWLDLYIYHFFQRFPVIWFFLFNLGDKPNVSFVALSNLHSGHLLPVWNMYLYFYVSMSDWQSHFLLMDQAKGLLQHVYFGYTWWVAQREILVYFSWIYEVNMDILWEWSLSGKIFWNILSLL